jgi:hypothetical protein
MKMIEKYGKTELVFPGILPTVFTLTTKYSVRILHSDIPQAFIAGGETEAHYRYYPKNTNPNLTWGSATATPKTLTLT